MATIGLKNLNYAIMTKEDTVTSAPVYATPKRLVGVNSVSVSHDTETAKLYGDNQALATKTKTKGSTITLEIADLQLEDKAAILGHTYDSETKTMSVGANDTAPYVAIMYEVNNHHDEKELHIFYKGKFSPAQEDTNTEGEGLEFGLSQLEGEFIYRLDNGKKEDTKIVADSDTITAASWFTSLNNA